MSESNKFVNFKARSVEIARVFYEKLITQFPNAGKYWKIYIEHELRSKNFENVEAVNLKIVAILFLFSYLANVWFMC